jgi:dihydrofolate reductase
MIKSIFAVDHWGGMGFKGSLPWPHHSEDLQYFKEQTQGQIVVMGRRTWDDPKMPKPLPGRTSYVATNRPLFGYDGVKTIRGNLCECIRNIAKINPTKTVWIIGGPDILLETKDLIDEAHITHFKGQFKSDVQIDIRKYLSLFRAYGAAPSSDRKCNWVTYKNIDIFRQSY